jgi:hypothetical protein
MMYFDEMNNLLFLKGVASTERPIHYTPIHYEKY